MNMNYTHYIPFLLFVAAAWIYYDFRLKKNNRLYRDRREKFIQKNSGLTSEQRENLSAGIPWRGMNTELLTELFGEPQRKRILDQSLTRTIWSYGTLFIYVENGKVTEWKRR